MLIMCSLRSVYHNALPTLQHRLADHDVWCPKCQRQSSLVKMNSLPFVLLKETWASYKPNISINVPLAEACHHRWIIPLLVLIWLAPA